MFVIMKESIAIACFEKQSDAVEYWKQHGGTIVLYPDLDKDSIVIR